MKNLLYKFKSNIFKYSLEAKKYKRPTYDELIKYQNFTRTKNNKLFLSFGSGRCGMNWFSKLFNSHKNWIGSAERFADYEAFYRFITYYKLPISKAGFFYLLKLSYKRDMALFQNSFISSPYWSVGVNEVTNKLKPDCIFFNIRNPINTIESFYGKGWYLHSDENNDINSPNIDISGSLYRSFSRIIPNDDYHNEWKSLTRIGKIAWYWCTINKFIYSDFKNINNIKKYNIKLEDVDQNYEFYEKISEKFDLKTKMKKNKFLDVINKAPNKSGNLKYFYKDWNQNEKNEFEKIIDNFFPHYEEIKTDI
tara:strand:- start:1573 stop:2496 length:924 start_codon:yes stop_codon:yes gene_type:complete